MRACHQTGRQWYQGTARHCSQLPPDPRIPVTLLTGFLGSGKTTLLNHILHAEHGHRLAVIQNEFGAASIDDALLSHHFGPEDGDIMYTSNGCLCCTARSDLEPALSQMYREHLVRPLDGIVIESTGLAKPSAIAETILVAPQSNFCRMDAVITMVDAKNGQTQLGMAGGEAAAQAVFADKIILNKCDLVDSETIQHVTSAVKQLNPLAEVRQTSHGQVGISELLGLNAFELETVERAVTRHEAGGHHHHERGATSVSIEAVGATLDYGKLQRWILTLANNNADTIWRIKGVLSVRQDKDVVERKKLVFQSVHGMVNGDWAGEWCGIRPRRSALVFIGNELDKAALQQSFDECVIPGVADL